MPAYYPDKFEPRRQLAAGVPVQAAPPLPPKPDPQDHKVSERKTLWKTYLNRLAADELDLPLVLLLAGGAGTGKSTLALELAYRLGLRNVIGTDMLRETLRAVYPAEQAPVLHLPTYRCWEPLSESYDEAALIAGFQQQCRQVQPAVQAILRRVLNDGEGIVIEGINLLPSLLMAENDPWPDNVILALLAIPTVVELQRRFELRSLSTHLKKPPARYAPRFAHIRAVHDYLVAEAQQHQVPIIDNQTFNQSIDQALDLVFASLGKLLSTSTQKGRQ